MREHPIIPSANSLILVGFRQIFRQNRNRRRKDKGDGLLINSDIKPFVAFI